MTYEVAGQVALAMHDVGFVEGPHNRNPYSYWQYGDSHEPYCASAFSYWAVEGGGFEFPDYCTYGWKGDSNVYWLGQHAKRMGIFRNAWVTARPGWAIMLSFGVPWQHVEMVIGDQGPLGYCSTIGGNTGNRVAYRTRYRSNIVGFMALDEAGQNAPAPPPPEEDDVKPNDPVDAQIHAKGGRYVLFANGKILAKDGAPYHGDLSTERPPAVVDMKRNRAVSLLLDPVHDGYWIELLDGSVHTFGKSAFHGVFHKDVRVPQLTAVRLTLAGDPAIGYKSVRSDGALMSPR